MKRIILLTILSFFISCGDTNTKQKNSANKSPMEGFWNRIGTIQLVNGIPVDTILVKNSDDKDYKQIKVFKDANSVWLNNRGDNTLPWKGGMGGYAKYKMHSKDSLTEYITHGTGWWGAYVKNLKDSLNIDVYDFGLQINYSGNIYSQKNSPQSDFAELWERMPVDKPSTKFDGAWKRVYEIAYVNDIPVDTTSVANDVILDVKIMSNGRYAYQVDMTGMLESDEAWHGGMGGFGTYKYDEEKNILKEYQEWGSGNFFQEFEPGTNETIHEVIFYDNDMFLQIDKSFSNVENGTLRGDATGRGVVYKRIK